MRAAIVMLSILVAIASPSRAQVVDLVCAGTMQSRPDNITATVAPGAAHIDLKENTIETPVGSFAISNVDGNTVTFSGMLQRLHAFGTLDRVTGAMSVFYRNDAEEQRMRQSLEHT